MFYERVAMTLPTLRDKKGFTIIEVVLVLAIAGLIFLVVFLALPALQRNQRDTQRRNDVGRAVTAVTNYSANNNGQIPTNQGELDTVGSDYLNVADDDFADPSEGDYDINYTADAPDLGEMNYISGATCEAGGAGSRTFKVTTDLEGGGTYCQDNR